MLSKSPELPLVVHQDYHKHLSTARVIRLKIRPVSLMRVIQLYLILNPNLFFNSNWTDPIYDNLKNLTGEALLSLLYEMSPKPSEIFSHVMFVGQFIDLNKDVDMIMTDMGMCVTILLFTFYYNVYSCFFTIDHKI